MKPLLYLSLALNVLLVLGGGGFLLYQAGSKNPLPVSASDEPVQSSPQRQTVNANVARFHWSQLDALDFPDYIARLRAIGCPESTIRDIVKGELDEIYEEKKQAATNSQAPRSYPKTKSAVGNAPPSASTTHGIAAALEQQKEKELATLLAAPSGNDVAQNSDSAVTGPTSGPPSTASILIHPSVLTAQRARAPAWPLIFTADPALGSIQAPSAGTMPQTASSGTATTGTGVANATAITQAPTLADLQQDFIDGIGGPNQDPLDPGYRERWLDAQNAADDQFRLFYGGRAFVQADVLRAQQAAAASGAFIQQGAP